LPCCSNKLKKQGECDMKNKLKAIILSAAAILGGAGLIFGNSLVLTNVLAAAPKTEPAIIMPANVPASEASLANVGLYANTNGGTYMALTNNSVDGQNEAEAPAADRTVLPKNDPTTVKKVITTRAPFTGTVLPGEGDPNEVAVSLSTEEATPIGINVIAPKYGLTQEDIKAFDVETGLFIGVWTVVLTPANQDGDHSLDYMMYVAEFTDDLSAVDVSGTAVSLSKEEATQAGINLIAQRYGLTQKDIEAFDTNTKLFMWTWTVILTPVNQEDYPTLNFYRAMFTDDLSSFDVMRAPLIKIGTPSDGEISSDKATEIAIPALTQKYALTHETVGKFTVSTTYFEMSDDIPDKHTWNVDLQPTNQNEFSEIGCYWAIIDAKTGEILRLCSAVDGKG
jgi:hypothetical protein